MSIYFLIFYKNRAMKRIIKIIIISFIIIIPCLYILTPIKKIYNKIEYLTFNTDNSINPKYDSILRLYANQRFVLIDYSLPSTKKRLWVIDNDSIILHTYVSHGMNSGFRYATDFSNTPKTNKSCIGKFKTLNSYHGKHGLSMRIQGLDATNNNAYSRNIVFHSADYVEYTFLIKHGYLGRSLGCFVTPKRDNEKIIKLATEKKSISVIVVN